MFAIFTEKDATSVWLSCFEHFLKDQFLKKVGSDPISFPAPYGYGYGPSLYGNFQELLLFTNYIVSSHQLLCLSLSYSSNFSFYQPFIFPCVTFSPSSLSQCWSDPENKSHLRTETFFMILIWMNIYWKRKFTIIHKPIFSILLGKKIKFQSNCSYLPGIESSFAGSGSRLNLR